MTDKATGAPADNSNPQETAERYHVEHYCWPQHDAERQVAEPGPTLYYKDAMVEVHKVCGRADR